MRGAICFDSPLGPLWIVHDGRALTGVRLGGERPHDTAEAAAPEHIIAAFRAYFDGDFASVAELPLALCGSVFQMRVWAAVRAIPPGRVASYADLARALGGVASGAGPNARAVGQANARNPVTIAVPCHRVVGADGRLTGYAGGLAAKAWLLAHEGWRPAQPSLLPDVMPGGVAACHA